MSSRLNIYNVVKQVCKVSLVHNLKPRITEPTAVIMRKSANESFGNTLCGWDNWIIYIFSPNSPLELDRLRLEIRRALFKADIEITHDMSDDVYDEELKCYVCSLTCRTPEVFDYNNE